VRSVYLIAIVLLICVFTGCGGGGSSTTAPTPTPGAQLAITSGNWDLGVTSASGPTFIIGGDVNQSGSTISGGVRVANSTCFTFGTAVPVSGTISGQTATVTSAAIASQTITATLTGSATALSGSYTVSGTGCAGGDKGTVTAVMVPSITATWKGTFTSNGLGNPQVGVSIPITEGTADNTGLFPLSGTATLTGSTCFSSGTLATGSGMAGRVVDVIIINSDGSHTEFIGNLTSPATPTQVTGTYTVTGGVCGGDSGTGTLTKQ